MFIHIARVRVRRKMIKIFDFLLKFIVYLQIVITFVNTCQKIGGIIYT
jgi:hypothetical protein